MFVGGNGVRVFLPLTPSPPEPKPGSLPPQAAALALEEDTVKPKQKIVDVTGRIRAGGSSCVPSNCGAGGR